MAFIAYFCRFDIPFGGIRSKVLYWQFFGSYLSLTYQMKGPDEPKSIWPCLRSFEFCQLCLLAQKWEFWYRPNSPYWRSRSIAIFCSVYVPFISLISRVWYIIIKWKVLMNVKHLALSRNLWTWLAMLTLYLL